MNRNKSPRLLRAPEVEAATGLSKSGRFYAMRDGSFPKPVKIGARAVAWVESDIHQWIEDRIAASRDNNQAA